MIESTVRHAQSLPDIRLTGATLERTRALTIAALVSLSLSIRVFSLGASGFSEDEINKLHAVEAYARGDITANAEHPMLMKLAVFASMQASEWWNAHDRLAAIARISPEAALRLPNALAGAATTGVVFLLAEALFDTATGAWASLFWAVDANAAAINRIGKEDTFLLFFLLLAAYLYERGKAASARSRSSANRWYVRSGASFGLMLASKYMPHYFGLHALFNIAADRAPRDSAADKQPSFFFAMLGAFVLGNAAIVVPATWRYIAGYARGDTVRHSGYDFAHSIYVNTIGASPWGVPPSFYATFLLTKVPLAVLAAAAVGIVWAARHPAHRGATFIRVFLVFTLLPYSFVASKFLRYMLPVLAVIDIAAAIGIVAVFRHLDSVRGTFRREALAAIVASMAVAFPFAEVVAAAPYYGLAQNALAARLSSPGALFPDDEFYDAGVREAVADLARVAAPGAAICSDATEVVAEYLLRDGRSDVRSCSISHDGVPMERIETWLLVQPGHLYFENIAVIEQARARTAPWRTVYVGGAPAAEVYLFREVQDRAEPGPGYEAEPHK